MLCLAAVISGLLAAPGDAQIQDGATLTVIRGTTLVVRADGSVLQPAVSGTTLTVGDRISTLALSGALVTFFEGSEVEMGSEASIAIRELSAQGARVNITLESIVGSTIHHVVALSDPGSSYRVESGSTVGLVRGTVFGHRAEPHGDVTLALQSCGTRVLPTGCLEFPRDGMFVQPGQVRTASARGAVDTDSFDSNLSLFDVIAEPAGNSNRGSGTDNPGLQTGSRVFPQQQSRQERDERDRAGPTATSGTVVTAIPTATRSLPPGQTTFSSFIPAGSRTLDVGSTQGFRVGDVIIINPGGATQEQNYVVGFGSIITGQPTLHNHFPGELITTTGVQVTSTATATSTPTSTGTPQPTFTPAPSSTPTSTVTQTLSPTVTPTQTPTLTATASQTSTQTPTSTPTLTPTSTQTPTSTATATPTSTSTATPSPTSTPGPFGSVQLAPQMSQPNPQLGRTFFMATYQVVYGSGPVMISGSPPPNQSFYVDDQIVMTVTRPDTTTATFDQRFEGGNCSGIRFLGPFDVTSLFQPGTNQVRVELRDTCGGVESTSSAIWLTN
jgi:hypothetical protein